MSDLVGMSLRSYDEAEEIHLLSKVVVSDKEIADKYRRIESLLDEIKDEPCNNDTAEFLKEKCLECINELLDVQEDILALGDTLLLEKECKTRE
jgi:hypothetical protein